MVVFFLQRAAVAKRCYATLLASAAHYVGPQSTMDIALPSPHGMQAFLSGLYRCVHVLTQDTVQRLVSALQRLAYGL